MASLTCPNCGKDNPDFLDNCQFCQTVLRREATLNIGENPIKKSTGELEEILPDWLREARQQSRDSAEEEAVKEAVKPRLEKEEPPDLLAGLAFQAASDEEEVPDWLAAINPVEKKTPAPSQPAEETPSDFFAQFNQPDQEPAKPADHTQKDELTDWLSQPSEEPDKSFRFDPGAPQDENAWMRDLKTSASPEPAAPVEPEDLGWLHDLESSSKQSAAPQAPQTDASWMSNFDSSPAPTSGGQDDMSWLNNLGGTPAPSFDEPAPAQPASSQDDLSWLNNLGGTPAPTFDEPESVQPASSQEDLSWLNNLGGTPAPSLNEPASPQPASSQDDMSWLNNLGGTPAPSFDEPAPAQAASSQDDLSWLNNLGGTPAPTFEEPAPTPFAQPEDTDWLKNIDNQQDSTSAPAPQILSPRHTAPLSEDAAHDSMPDWLRSATAEPSMPPLGATSMDWFSSKDQPADQARLKSDELQDEYSTPQISPAPLGSVDQTQDVPASVNENIFSSASDSSSLSNQDVDSLFAVEMPDWFSQPEPITSAPTTPGGMPSEPGDSLSPVNLPSWVQAMRPVEAAISEASALSPDQTTEKEGPLAGFRGVIPFAPIGSAQRPKAISLKLQATDEQQTSAALLEQILANETTAQPLKTTPFVVSQRALRWTLSGLFMLVLGVTIGLSTKQMPVSAVLPIEVSNASNVVATMPDSALVLVVIDYEPALAGEMEAVAGPLLDQMAVLRHSNFTFISTSPNGSALVERLMTNTKINKPAPAGLGYQSGLQYFNTGYLPGGSAGVRGFTEQPKTVMPLVNVNQFSDFATVVVITDHAESGLVWIEQIELWKQNNPVSANQPLVAVASAQAGPLLQPYVSSGQMAGMVSGLSDAARYEFVNNSRPGIARSYWDAFGVGLFMAVVSIVLGSLWSLFTGIRARRAEAGQG